MSDQFLGEMRPFAFNFAPVGWQICQGQTLAITQFAALFSLLGTYYGGNGTTNFQLPNLQGRVPLNQGTSAQGGTYAIGEIAGEENVTLTSSTMPMHNHAFAGMNATAGKTDPAAGDALATNRQNNAFYGPASSLTSLNLNSVSVAPTSGNQPHPNIQPYLAINWCIAMSGVFPARG